MSDASPTPPLLPRPAVVTLSGLMDELLWPRLLRAPVLALRFDRMAIAFIAVTILGLASSLPTLWGAEAITLAKVSAVGDASLTHSAAEPGLLLGLASWVLSVPAMLLANDEVGLAIFVVIKLLVLATLGAGIARSAACEFSAGVMMPGTQAVAFGLKRWMSGFGAVLVPLLVAAAIGLIVAVVGLAFRVPGLDVLGAILYPLLAILSLLAVLILACMALGGAMLVPAVAAECTDALDAVQRVFNYILHRPLSLAIYLVIAILISAAAAGVGAALLSGTFLFLDSMTLAWSGTRGQSILAGGGEGTTTAIAGAIVEFVRLVLTVILAGYVFSLAMCSGTILYLIMRQKNDAQHWSELWFPTALAREVAAETPGPPSSAGSSASDFAD